MLMPKLIACLTLIAGAANAGPLADMSGDWSGSGWARETPNGPQETVRCRIKNTYTAATDTLELSGQCVVPGRRLTVAGTLTGTDGSERITGRWSNPNGIGSTRIVGIQRAGVVAFNFSAPDPATGRKLAQNVEWRISDGALRLRSSERSNPDLKMSDITFGR